MSYTKMIEIQKLTGEKWTPYYRCHAAPNKASGGESLDAGSMQSQETMSFDVRYCSLIAAIRHKTQAFQIRYAGQNYKIVDYDDYMERHRTIRLKGVRYHG